MSVLKNKNLIFIINQLQKIDLNKTIFVAYSGGLDSTVLLYLLASELPKDIIKRIKVVHINHGLSPNAKIWESHCLQFCHSLGMPLEIITIAINPKSGEGLEAAARTERYLAIANLIKKGDYLLTAHHKSDQIETFLLQLFRGAGIKGLASMPTLKKFSEGYLFRPLLAYTREELMDYALAHQLTWIDDESNFDLNYRRNFLRHEIIPKLKENYPNLETVVARSIRHCQMANELLDDLAIIDLKKIEIDGNLNVELLLKLTEARINNCLRTWILRNNFEMPSELKLAEIRKIILSTKKDTNPIIHWATAEVRKYQNFLYIMKPLSPFDNSQIFTWQFNKILKIPGLDITLTPQVVEQYKNFIPNGLSQATVHFRQGGEKMQIPNRTGTRQLKKIFQERKIPPWLRERIPLIYHENRLLFFYGY